MMIADLVVLPVGCILCGIMASAGILLRYFRGLGSLLNALLPYATVIGAVTAVSAALSLIFPFQGPPVFGSLFPSAAGLLLGLLFCLELLTGSRLFSRRKELLIQLGNALLYLKVPLGLASILFGILHLFYSSQVFL